MADYVVVGAGAAGCVLAARLAETPGVRVTVIEAGGSDGAKEVRIPPAFPKLFRTASDWAFDTEPDPGVQGRRMYWPRGKMVGGSASMNAMMYVRGHASDYDAWAQAGNPGWSYADVLPYFRRSERFAGGADEFHGADGPWHVVEQASPNVLTKAFVEAVQSLGYPRNDDINGAVQDGVGFTHVTQWNGRRWSPADAFLKPAVKRGAVELVTNALCRRVVFQGRRAVGVEIERGGSVEIIRAAREVILCAGAIGTPHLLMLSGIGPAEHLAEMGLSLVQDLPGVGGNLQDHLAGGSTYRCLEPVTLDKAETLGNLLRWFVQGKGPLASNVGEGLAFVRTREGLVAPDIELIFAPVFFMAHGAKNPEGPGFSIACILLRPESRGQIRLKSPDPRTAPAIRPNYFSARADIDTMLAGGAIARKVAAAKPFDRWRGEEVWPGSHLQTEAELEAFTRGHVETLYHPVGTAKMGRDPMAVVDPTLKVHGLDGLRVADASVMPTLIGGHTQAPAAMIAEKAADLARG